MLEDLLLKARWVLPVTRPPIEGGAVWVREGRIAACGPEETVRRQVPPGVRELDLGSSALLPGFVNAHTHLELTALRGFVEERDFFAWIRRLTRTKYERLDREDLYHSALWGVVEALRSGTTAVGEVCDPGVSVAALRAGRLRAVVYQELFGPGPGVDAARASLRELEAKLAAHREVLPERISLGISPHAPYSVSEALFREAAAQAAARGLPLCVHAAESRAEEDLLLRGTGPFASFLRERGIEWRPPRCSTVEYLARLGVLEARPLLAHCVRVSRRDIDLLARSGARVAHCPKSNAKLGHGTAPLAEIAAAGVPVGIGTDGAVSNNACDPLDEVRAAALLERVRQAAGQDLPEALATPRDCLRLLTLGGAEALGLEERVGSLEPGKEADLAGVDLSGPHATPVHDVEAALVWCATARDVVLTVVGGEVVYFQGKVLTVDEEAVGEALEGVTRKLAEA